MNTKTKTDTSDLREFTDQELAAVSGGLTVVEAIQNAVKTIRAIVFPLPDVNCFTFK